MHACQHSGLATMSQGQKSDDLPKAIAAGHAAEDKEQISRGQRGYSHGLKDAANRCACTQKLVKSHAETAA